MLVSLRRLVDHLPFQFQTVYTINGHWTMELSTFSTKYISQPGFSSANHTRITRSWIYRSTHSSCSELTTTLWSSLQTPERDPRTGTSPPPPRSKGTSPPPPPRSKGTGQVLLYTVSYNIDMSRNAILSTSQFKLSGNKKTSHYPFTPCHLSYFQ